METNKVTIFKEHYQAGFDDGKKGNPIYQSFRSESGQTSSSIVAYVAGFNIARNESPTKCMSATQKAVYSAIKNHLTVVQ